MRKNHNKIVCIKLVHLPHFISCSKTILKSLCILILLGLVSEILVSSENKIGKSQSWSVDIRKMNILRHMRAIFKSHNSAPIRQGELHAGIMLTEILL